MRLGQLSWLLLLLLPEKRIWASVLSSSQLEACINDGSEQMDCELKMVLTVTLEHGQQSTESAQFLIREVKDAKDDVRKLKKPWQVSWVKSRAFWRYPIRYVQDVNNKPSEGVKQVGWLSCNDNPLSTAEAVTCDVAYIGDTRVPDSEGFCCGCDLGKMVSGQPTRSSADCGLFTMSDSAHCLNFDGLWYSVYEVDRPQIFYNITINILLPTEYKLGWNVTYRQTSLFLSHHQPVASAEGGTLRAELVGDLAAAVAPHRFESKYLVVPQRPAGHERVTPSTPLQNAMLLDRSLFDLSGRTCDKIGVSFPAFRYQAEKCDRPAGSCLHSQLDDFHSEDAQRLSSGQQPLYRIQGYCDGALELAQQSSSAGTQVFLACPLSQRHTTLLRLEARADSAMFVTNVAPGRIAVASAPNFEALSGGGEVELVVINTGLVVADYTVGLTNCTGGLNAGPAQSLSLTPLESAEISLRLYASGDGSGTFRCDASLFDSLGALTDTLAVEVNVTALQRDDGAQGGGGGGGDSVEAVITGSDCAAVCPGFFDIMCFVAHACWTQLGWMALAVVVLLVVAYACCWMSLRGLPCRLCWCLCKCAMPSRAGSAVGSPYREQEQLWQQQLQAQQQFQVQQMQMQAMAQAQYQAASARGMKQLHELQLSVLPEAPLELPADREGPPKRASRCVRLPPASTRQTHRGSRRSLVAAAPKVKGGGLKKAPVARRLPKPPIAEGV